MPPRAPLEALAAALQGRPPAEHAWIGVLDLANHALVSPHLAAAMAARGDLPEDIAAFLRAVLSSNRRRNQALRAQAVEAARALNAAGVIPLLLKGAAALFDSGSSRLQTRMLSDLDLLVQPPEVAAALDALSRDGYAIVGQRLEAEVHAVADLAKPGTLAAIDLHQRPPGPPGMVRIAERPDLCRLIEVEGSLLRVPCGALQIYLTMMHDQLHDGDYWSGRLDLRHLLDIADLAAAGAVDWALLEELPPTRLTRNALHTQLADAHWLTGTEIPGPALDRAWPRLQSRRRRLQGVYPWLAGAGGTVTLLGELANLLEHRRADRAGRQVLFGYKDPRWRLDLSWRLSRLRRIFRARHASKIGGSS